MLPFLPFSLLGCADLVAPGSPTQPASNPSEPLEPFDTGVAVTAPCFEAADLRACDYQTVAVSTGLLSNRDVHFQVPEGVPPAGGWPVAFLFQGSFFSGERSWEARPGDPYGAWHQTGTVHALLQAGYAVITPETQGEGLTFWNTNVPPWAWAWETSPDHRLMLALFEGIDDGLFGPLDPDRLYAGGISSGGYMTSRMALSYPGRFRALAVHSASWATCGGLACVVPQGLPSDHPPTLFLHGEDDLVVPIGTMETYAERLGDQGHAVRVVTDPDVGHAWLDVAPVEIVGWFDGSP